jgi:tRNA A-37 threonylcarbamoyl transferase component Bud32
MTIIEFTDNINNIKISNKTDIEHPFHNSFSEDDEYIIEKIYNNLQINSDINIIVEDYIYSAEYDISTVYPVIINGNNNYVVKKGLLESEEILINEIILQNKASEFGLSDPIVFAYILEGEYGLIMKKYEDTLFRIFDCEYFTIEDKTKYLDKIKIMLEDLSEKANIHHGNFNLCNIMIDENDNIKLVDFDKACFINNINMKSMDTDNFTKCGLYLETITEEVTFDLENYWYSIMIPLQ